MARIFHKKDLPHFVSTRDTRDRLDLLTENVPLPAQHMRADRIRYHPGDTAARHYHVGSLQAFCVLEGEGKMYVDDREYRLKPGMVAIVYPEEVHWFENDTDRDFVFVEFWAPPPKDTVWVIEHDC